MLSLSSALISPTIKCSSDFGYLPYLNLLYIQIPDISNSKHTWCVLDCLDLIFITFKPPTSRSRAYCDCNPIRAFETFYISKELTSKTSRFWMFWYKRDCYWLSAIKGMALWLRGFSHGSLFKTWPRPKTAHEKPLAPRVVTPLPWGKFSTLLCPF